MRQNPISGNAPGLPAFSRRTLLCAAPAALIPLAGSASAVRTLDLSPVAAMFREWRAHSAWLNGPETDGCPEEQFNAHCEENVRIIERMVREPCRDMADLCLKLLALTDFGTFVELPGLASLDQLQADTCALVGERP